MGQPIYPLTRINSWLRESASALQPFKCLQYQQFRRFVWVSKKIQDPVVSQDTLRDETCGSPRVAGNKSVEKVRETFPLQSMDAERS